MTLARAFDWRSWILWTQWLIATASGTAVGIFAGSVFGTLTALAVRASVGGFHTVDQTMSIPGVVGVALGVPAGLMAAGSVIGFTLGVSQWLVLRRALDGAARWLALTTLGGALAGLVIALMLAVFGLGDLGALIPSLVGAVVGLGAGVARWRFGRSRRRSLAAAAVYPVAGLALGVAGGAVLVAALLALAQAMPADGAFRLVCGMGAGAAIGAMQLRVLRQKFERAGWWLAACTLAGGVCAILSSILPFGSGASGNAQASAMQSAVLGDSKTIVYQLLLWPAGGFGGAALIGAVGGAITGLWLRGLSSRPLPKAEIHDAAAFRFSASWNGFALALSLAAALLLPLHYAAVGRLEAPPAVPRLERDFGNYSQWQRALATEETWYERRVIRTFAWTIFPIGVIGLLIGLHKAYRHRRSNRP